MQLSTAASAEEKDVTGTIQMAAAPSKQPQIEEPPRRHGLFFEPQEDAWCGMHALNNYCLKGQLVDQDACRAAARLVVQRLS